MKLETKANINVAVQSSRGFTLIELLCALAVLLVIVAIVIGVGWGLAFAFSSYVLVPFIGVPAEWVNAVTIFCSVLLTGVGVGITWFAILLSLTGLSALFKGKRTSASTRRRRRG